MSRRRRRRTTRLLSVPRWWLGLAFVAGPVGWVMAIGAGWQLFARVDAEVIPLVVSTTHESVARPPRPFLSEVSPRAPVAPEAALMVASEAVDAGQIAVVEVVEPPPASLSYARRAPRGRYGLQVGAYPTLEEAEAFLREHLEALASAGPAHVIERRVRGETWYRVRIGAHRREAEAEAARSALPDALGAGAMVVRYK